MAQPEESGYWPLMTCEELHAFGINLILPYLEREGVRIEAVNKDMKTNPQVVGKRWGSPAFIHVRTACYPSKGRLAPDEVGQLLAWSSKYGATAFFASVGLACACFPDQRSVTADRDRRLPIRGAGFHVAYPGLTIMTTAPLP